MARFRTDHLEECLNSGTFPTLLFWVSTDVFLVNLKRVNSSGWTADVALHFVHWDRLKGRIPGNGTKYYSYSRHRYVINLDKMVASEELKACPDRDQGDFKAYQLLPPGTRCWSPQTPSPVSSPEVCHSVDMPSITNNIVPLHDVKILYISIPQDILLAATQNGDLLGLAVQETRLCHNSEEIPKDVTFVNTNIVSSDLSDSSSETLNTVPSGGGGISSPRDCVAPQLSIEPRSEVLEMSNVQENTNSLAQLQEIVPMNGLDDASNINEIANFLKSAEGTYYKNLDESVCNSPRQTTSAQGATDIDNAMIQDSEHKDLDLWYETFVDIENLISRENNQMKSDESNTEEKMDCADELPVPMNGEIDFSALTDNYPLLNFESLYGTSQTSSDSKHPITEPKISFISKDVSSDRNMQSFYDNTSSDQMELDEPEWLNRVFGLVDGFAVPQLFNETSLESFGEVR